MTKPAGTQEVLEARVAVAKRPEELQLPGLRR